MRISPRHLVVLSLLALPAYAAAQAPPVPRPITIKSVRFNGTGCPAGQAVESFDDSRTRATLIFSGNTASAGPGTLSGGQRRQCEITFALDLNEPEPESKAMVVLRGYAALPAGASAEILTDWSWSSALGGNEKRDVLKGGAAGLDDNFVLTRELTLAASSGKSGALSLDASLQLPSGAAAMLSLDSIDLAIGPPPVETSFNEPDATPPVISYETSITPSPSGWYAGEVLVSFRCEDPESAIVPELSDLAPKLLTATGLANAKCVNVTGNSSALSANIRIDTIGPVILGGIVGAGLIARDARVPSGLACFDDGSGVEHCGVQGWLDTAAIGAHSFTSVARDRAGHVTSTPGWYVVGDASACADEGWRSFSTPMFRNEDECLRTFQSREKGQ